MKNTLAYHLLWASERKQAGREVLLKAVIQAIPAYSMSCFKLPISLCHEIETMIRQFWWGQRGTRRRIHWVKWRTLCRQKAYGGMGFRELRILMTPC